MGDEFDDEDAPNVLEPSITADGIVHAWPANKSPEFYVELAEANALEEMSIDELIFQRVDTDSDEPNEGGRRRSGGIFRAAGAIEGSAQYPGNGDFAAWGAGRRTRSQKAQLNRLYLSRHYECPVCGGSSQTDREQDLRPYSSVEMFFRHSARAGAGSLFVISIAQSMAAVGPAAIAVWIVCAAVSPS